MQVIRTNINWVSRLNKTNNVRSSQLRVEVRIAAGRCLPAWLAFQIQRAWHRWHLTCHFHLAQPQRRNSAIDIYQDVHNWLGDVPSYLDMSLWCSRTQFYGIAFSMVFWDKNATMPWWQKISQRTIVSQSWPVHCSFVAKIVDLTVWCTQNAQFMWKNVHLLWTMLCRKPPLHSLYYVHDRLWTGLEVL